jgi:diguanylate cyclase (GGDEF)-like protein
LTIDNIALAALVFAVVVIAAVSTIAIASAQRLISINEEVLRTQRLVSSVEAIRFYAMALEGGEQNFVITGNERDLSAYKEGGVEIVGEIGFLRGKIGESTVLRDNFVELETSATAYVARIAEIVAARRQAGFTAAQALVRARDSEHLQARLLGATHRLLNAFRRQQGALEAEQIEHGDRVKRLIIALISSSVFVLVLLYGSLRRLSNEQRRAEQRFRHQALHDSLTGLPNRHAIMEHLAARLADRDAVVALGGLALMLVDLDGFKEINDRHGHDGGDELLKQVAARARATLRDTDFVARLGGDEFLVVIPQVSDRETAALVAQKLIDAIGKPFALGQIEAQVGASIGIAIFPRDAGDREGLLKCADAALYQAKAAGRNRLRFHVAAEAEVPSAR